MRIVHELYGEADVDVTTFSYSEDDFSVDVAIETEQGEQLYIEGDARSVLAALETAANKIRANARALIASGNLIAKWRDSVPLADGPADVCSCPRCVAAKEVN